MLDETPQKTDNVLEPIFTDGKRWRINKSDLPKGRTHCKNHDFVVDKGEVHEAMQGYICINCQFGKLVRRN